MNPYDVNEPAVGAGVLRGQPNLDDPLLEALESIEPRLTLKPRDPLTVNLNCSPRVLD